MGCFDYGCAVTGVSIAAGDPVLHVVVLGKGINSAYEIMNAVHRYESHVDLDSPLFRSADAQELAKRIAAFTERYFRRDFIVQFGHYNDYGWIEEHDRGNMHPMDIPNFMVKREAVEVICRQAGVTDMGDMNAVLKAVSHFLFMCRINPFATLSGIQHFDRSEAAAHELRVKLINAALAEKVSNKDGDL